MRLEVAAWGRFDASAFAGCGDAVAPVGDGDSVADLHERSFDSDRCLERIVSGADGRVLAELPCWNYTTLGDLDGDGQLEFARTYGPFDPLVIVTLRRVATGRDVAR